MLERVLTIVALAATVYACSRAPETATAQGEGGLGPFGALSTPAGAGSAQPRLTADPAGGLVLSWLEPGADGQVALKYARLRADQWGPSGVAAEGHDWVVSDADLPSVRLLTDRVWAADWRVPDAESPYAYNIRVAVSADAGATWSDSLLLNDDGTPTEHGFVSWYRVEGRVGALWLDGRDQANEDFLAPDGTPYGTSLRYALLGEDGKLLEQGVIDRLACDCCQTDTAATSRGVAVVYRDRSPDEIRDVAVRVGTVEGWSEPTILGPDDWEIEGCPVNGPALDANGDEVVAAWFTAAGGQGRVRLARSTDGGIGFGPAVDVDDGDAVGHVGVALADDGTAFVSWWRRAATGGAELAVRGVTAAGQLGTVRVVTTTSASRPETVPQLERNGNRLVIAWTDDVNKEVAVKIAYAELTGGV